MIAASDCSNPEREKLSWLTVLIRTFEQEHDWETDDDPSANREMCAAVRGLADELEKRQIQAERGTPDCASQAAENLSSVFNDLLHYAKEGRDPGRWVLAILANDLRDAVLTANPGYLSILPTIVAHMWNSLPRVCWGSRERVKDWMWAKQTSAT